MLKSNARVRFAPPLASAPPVVPRPSMPLTRIACRSAPGRGRRCCALPLIAGDRHARDALDRFREVVVGEFGDVLGLDHVDHAIGIALFAQRGGERRTESGNDDLSGGRRLGNAALVGRLVGCSWSLRRCRGLLRSLRVRLRECRRSRYSSDQHPERRRALQTGARDSPRHPNRPLMCIPLSPVPVRPACGQSAMIPVSYQDKIWDRKARRDGRVRFRQSPNRPLPRRSDISLFVAGRP